MDVAEKRMLAYDKKRGLILPESYSSELAELVGVIFGDGYLSEKHSYSYRLSIFGHSVDDYGYHTVYLRNLIKHLFGLEPKITIRKDMQCMSTKIFSKRITIFLKNIGLETGKKEDLNIPQWIIDNDSNMISFLRGFVDSDGSIALKKRYRKIPYYPVIGLVSKSKILINDMAIWLKQNGFSFWSGYDQQLDKRSGNIQGVHRIYLNGHKQLVKWKNLIGFSNPKHLKKYEIWKERNKEKLFKLNISSNL